MREVYILKLVSKTLVVLIVYWTKPYNRHAFVLCCLKCLLAVAKVIIYVFNFLDLKCSDIQNIITGLIKHQMECFGYAVVLYVHINFWWYWNKTQTDRFIFYCHFSFHFEKFFWRILNMFTFVHILSRGKSLSCHRTKNHLYFLWNGTT